VSQQWWAEQNLAGGTPLANFEQKLGTPNNFGAPGFPNITGIITPFNGTMFLYGLTQIIQNLDENLTKTVGRHQLRFGFRYRHERFKYLPDRAPDAVAFGAYATALENPASGANYSATANTGSGASTGCGSIASSGRSTRPRSTWRKSSAARRLQDLIDPSGVTGRGLPREERDLAAAVAARHLVSYDNLSALPSWPGSPAPASTSSTA